MFSVSITAFANTLIDFLPSLQGQPLPASQVTRGVVYTGILTSRLKAWTVDVSTLLSFCTQEAIE